jgi:hypothetical protein
METQPAPEKKPRRSILDVPRKLRDIVSLTPQEQALIICILLSVAAGSVIKHYRDVYRESHPVIASPAPKPSLRAKDIYAVP